MQDLEPSAEAINSARPDAHSSAQRANCNTDTVFYEDFSNGFAGANDSAISWDTSGTYQTIRECGSLCPTNGAIDISGAMSSPTQSNGMINMDIQWKAGYIWGPGQGGGDPEGPAPEQHMTMSDVLDLSNVQAPVITLHTAFGHCCALDHEVLVEVDTNMSGNWDTKFDISANVDRGEIEGGKYSFHLGPAIQGASDSVRVRFTWPPTGPDANGQVSGYYSWYIDDVVIREASLNDLAMENTVYVPTNSAYYSDIDAPIEYTMVPKCHMDSLDFGAQVCNIGRNNLGGVRMQATVTDQETGAQVFQTTSSPFSVDSISCIGGEVSGYRPPIPDTVFGQDGLFRRDTSTYTVEYEAIIDTASDCDPSNNLGPAEEFQITHRTFAIDECYGGGSPGGSVVTPAGGGGYKRANAYNAFEFTWADPNEDTVEQVSVYIHDTTQVGAGPITVGISSQNGPVFRKSEEYFIKSSDIGSWVTLDLVLDSNGQNVGGLPVPVGDGTFKTAFVKYPGGSERVGYGTCGLAQDAHAFVEGDFGGAGDALYGTGDVPMIRAHMNKPADTIEATACDSFTVPSGDATYSSSGMYRDTMPGVVGCDSMYTVDLTIQNSTSASITGTGCSEYTVPSGDETYTSSGTYMDTVSNSVGCDSILTVNVTLGTADTAVNKTGATELTAKVSGANSYQWLDCDDGYSEISGATSQSYQASSNGNYAVVVSNDGCTDTSGCHSITGVGFEDRQENRSAELYPNPTTGQFTLDLGEAGRDVRMKITDLQGRTIKSQDHIDSRRVQFELDQPEGIYMVHLNSGDKSEVIKLVKE